MLEPALPPLQPYSRACAWNHSGSEIACQHMSSFARPYSVNSFQSGCQAVDTCWITCSAAVVIDQLWTTSVLQEACRLETECLQAPTWEGGMLRGLRWALSSASTGGRSKNVIYKEGFFWSQKNFRQQPNPIEGRPSRKKDSPSLQKMVLIF